MNTSDMLYVNGLLIMILNGKITTETFKLQHSESKGRRYTDRLGRSVFAIALAARDNNATECLANARPGEWRDL